MKPPASAHGIWTLDISISLTNLIKDGWPSDTAQHKTWLEISLLNCSNDYEHLSWTDRLISLRNTCPRANKHPRTQECVGDPTGQTLPRNHKQQSDGHRRQRSDQEHKTDMVKDRIHHVSSRKIHSITPARRFCAGSTFYPFCHPRRHSVGEQCPQGPQPDSRGLHLICPRKNVPRLC